MVSKKNYFQQNINFEPNIFHYILENSKPPKRKLWQSCKELFYKIRKCESRCVDILSLGHPYAEHLFITGENIQANLNFHSSNFTKTETLLTVKKILFASGLKEFSLDYLFLARLDLSYLTILSLHTCEMCQSSAFKLSALSIKELSWVNVKIIGWNEIKFVLENFSTVNNLELLTKDDFYFTQLTEIKNRSQRLNTLRFGYLPSNFTSEEAAIFASKYMAPGSEYILNMNQMNPLKFAKDFNEHARQYFALPPILKVLKE